MTQPFLLVALTVLIVIVFNDVLQTKKSKKDWVNRLMELTIIVSSVFLLVDVSVKNLAIVISTIVITSCLTKNIMYKEHFLLIKSMVHHDDTKAFYSFDHLYPSSNNKEELESLKEKNNITINVEYPQEMGVGELKDKAYVPFEPKLSPELKEVPKEKIVPTTQSPSPPEHPIEFEAINNIIVENTFLPQNMTFWEKMRFLFSNK